MRPRPIISALTLLYLIAGCSDSNPTGTDGDSREPTALLLVSEREISLEEELNQTGAAGGLLPPPTGLPGT